MHVDALAHVVVADCHSIAARAGAALGVPCLTILVCLLAHMAHTVAAGGNLRNTFVSVAAGAGLAVSGLHQAAHLVRLAVLSEAVIGKAGTPSADAAAAPGRSLRRQRVAVLGAGLGHRLRTHDGRAVPLVTGAFLVRLGDPADSNVGEALEGRLAHSTAPGAATRQPRHAAHALAAAAAPIHDQLVQTLEPVVSVFLGTRDRRAPLVGVALLVRRARRQVEIVVRRGGSPGLGSRSRCKHRARRRENEQQEAPGQRQLRP